ncbi:MAG: primosomal protein N' (replication factor Y) - superfamily II helicase [Pseudomonadota bacterium]
MSDIGTVSGPVAEHRFPCDACGSDLRYNPRAQMMSCDHCGQTADVFSRRQHSQSLQELDLEKGLATDLPLAEMEETRVTSCPNCAAQVAFEGGKHATDCPFCATPVVIDTGTNRHIKPRAVLPFVVDDETAQDAMSTWLGKLWFAPSGLKQYARKGRRMQGIYVPYWTYDAQTRTRYRGERGTIYYVTRTVTRDGKQVQERVQKIRWRPASGRVSRFFDDILVLASTSLPKKYTDALEPWDLSALEPYAPEYLAGFRAEAYAVSLEDGFKEAKAHMDRVINRDVKFDIGGDRQRVHDVQTERSDLTFKHILLPVWLAAYKYRGTSYRFVVNGRTGQVQGERPYSAVKITIAVVCGLIIAGAIGYLAAQQ